jgi:hypothetical protein
LKGGIPNLATYFVVWPTFREVLVELSSFPGGGLGGHSLYVPSFDVFHRCLPACWVNATTLTEPSKNIQRTFLEMSEPATNILKKSYWLWKCAGPGGLYIAACHIKQGSPASLNYTTIRPYVTASRLVIAGAAGYLSLESMCHSLCFRRRCLPTVESSLLPAAEPSFPQQSKISIVRERFLEIKWASYFSRGKIIKIHVCVYVSCQTSFDFENVLALLDDHFSTSAVGRPWLHFLFWTKVLLKGPAQKCHAQASFVGHSTSLSEAFSLGKWQ